MTYPREIAAERYPYNTPAGYDFKAWAKRILYRLELRDPDLTALQIAFAREALNIKPEEV